MKLALLPAAVAASLLGGNAMAGTEACFEVYRPADVQSALNHVFEGADCSVPRTGAGTETLAPVNPLKVAFEMTGGNEFALSNVAAGQEDVVAVYIPTSNLSPSTTIVMKLSDNAVFGNNGNILHLMAYDGANPIAVASTDGLVNDQNEIMFIVRDTPIKAGTRLAISRSNLEVQAPVIKVNNEGCPVDSDVTISVPRVRINSTDGVNGLPVEGAETKADEVIINADRQFVFTGQNVHPATRAIVNSQPDSVLTQFVVALDSNGNVVQPYTNKHTLDNVVWDNGFTDRAAELDKFVTLQPGDRVGMNLFVDGGPARNVAGSFHMAPTAGAAILDPAQANYLATDAVVVDIPGVASNTYPITNGTNVLFRADEVFRGAGTFNGALNITSTGEMGYHYETESQFGLFFSNREQRKLLNQAYACNAEILTHSIDVNGAVLKVPYALNSGGNWVRITNESSQPASIIVTVFDEKTEGQGFINEPVTLLLDPAIFGELKAYDSSVIPIPRLMTEVRRATGLQHSSRVTLTFTVTAPKDEVHAVSVLNTGGADRTMPVLDQNAWNQ